MDRSNTQARRAALDAVFMNTFSHPPTHFFSAPGRTELGGNHTDHQHGRVLAAAIDMDILAAVRERQDDVVRVQSEGYPLITVKLDALAPLDAEKNSSAALIRGVAAKMRELGGRLGGFDACLTSNVPGGSGLSSSAAFEVLFGTIFNVLYNEGRFSAVELARIGQYAENVYFGKPSGLLDQSACAVGGVVAIDFEDPAHMKIERIDVDFADYGYALCIIDSHASHADLTHEYAAIPQEMKRVSALFGKDVLREVSEAAFFENLPRVRKEAGDRAALRAMHFFAEDRRAAEEAEALRRGDFDAFLSLVRSSGASSAQYLQNVTPVGSTDEQALMLTIALAERLLSGRGAVRVHGGGFGGTAQAFVPLEMVDTFRSEMEAVLGAGSCHVLHVRPVGGVELHGGDEE